MGKAASHAQRYLRNPVVFADVFNKLCFDGEDVISSNDLTPLNTDDIFENVRGNLSTFYRDLLMRLTGMKYRDGILALLGLEHQSYINYEMPLRCLHYDVMTLLRQCEDISNARSLSTGQKKAFSLGQLQENEHPAPVFTAVLYVGEEPWTGPRTLRQVVGPIPAEIAPFFNDYRMLLLTPNDIKKTDLKKFKSELGMALYYAQVLRNKKRMQEFIHETDLTFSRQTAEFLNASLKTKIDIKEDEQEVKMSNAWDEQFADGVKAGMEKGLEEGREEGMMEGVEFSRKEIATRLIASLRSQKSEDEICSVIQSIIGVDATQARAYLTATH